MQKNNKKGEGFVISISVNPLMAAAITGVVLAGIVWAALGTKFDQAAASSNGYFTAQYTARGFYLTPDTYTPLQVKSACEQGYHFASLWELLDTSNLTYNRALGAEWPLGDQGGGPPSSTPGWVRTGYESKSDSGIPGRDNCLNWTGEEINQYGTSAKLRSNWASTSGSQLHGWEVMVVACDQSLAVWCVED